VPAATYILTFVPNLGPMIACTLPLPIVLLDTSVPLGAAALAVLLPALVSPSAVDLAPLRPGLRPQPWARARRAL
jgi:hypothetical protein